jgi:hypothetical protein
VGRIVHRADDAEKRTRVLVVLAGHARQREMALAKRVADLEQHILQIGLPVNLARRLGEAQLTAAGDLRLLAQALIFLFRGRQDA